MVVTSHGPLIEYHFGHHLIDCTTGNGGKVEILSFDLVEVMPFAHPLARRHDQFMADARNEGLEIRRNFFDGIRIAIAGDEEDFAQVTIEETPTGRAERATGCAPMDRKWTGNGTPAGRRH